MIQPSSTHNVAELDSSNPGALAELVRDAAARGVPVVDYGVAHAGVGNPPPAEHTRLVQRGGILEHYQRDFTVRVAAGATFGQVQAELRKTGQFIPLDADDDLSIGEIITHNVYGPMRTRYGASRDLLLGLHYIDGQGRDIHVGGRTVKNVAGLDVTRLMVGSLGELGVVYEATLRTYALPEQVMVVDVTVADPAKLDVMLTPWLRADAAPESLLLHYSGGQWMMRVGYHGRLTACTAQLHSLQTMLEDQTDGLHITGNGQATLPSDTAEQALERAWRRRVAALAKLVVPPASCGAVAAALVNGDVDVTRGLTLDVLPAHGVIFVGGEFAAQEAVALDQRIARLLEPRGGLRVWYARPAGAQQLEPFWPAQPDRAVAQRLKSVLDPHNILNPGRYLAVERR